MLSFLQLSQPLLSPKLPCWASCCTLGSFSAPCSTAQWGSSWLGVAPPPAAPDTLLLATCAHRVMGKPIAEGKHDTDALSKPHWLLVFRSDLGSQMCLNECYFILLLGGAFAGFSYSLLGVIHNMNYVPFSTVQVGFDFSWSPFKSLSSTSLRAFDVSSPWSVLIISQVVCFPRERWCVWLLPQQHKYFRVKGSVLMVLRCSATLALYTVRNFTVLYLFLGKWFLFGKLWQFSELFFFWWRGHTVLTLLNRTYSQSLAL